MCWPTSCNGAGPCRPNSLSARVAEFGEPLLVPHLDVADYPTDAFPEPWPSYLATHPIHGLIAVPIPINDAETGVLLVARRSNDSAYTADDLHFVQSGARRLVGQPARATDADDTDAVGRVVVRWISRQRRRLLLQEMLLGACLPVAITAALRYQRVNKPMASMNGLTRVEHVGVRPGDLSPIAGQRYEHLLRRVRETGQPITDHEVTILMPEIGLERHWNVSLQPLRDGGSEVVGIGAAVTDVTHEIVSRRQAERLLQLSESLTTALDEQQIAESVTSFLIDTFKGRATVALRDNDALVVAALAGFSDVDTTRLIGSRLMLLDDDPIAEAVARTRQSSYETRRTSTGGIRISQTCAFGRTIQSVDAPARRPDWVRRRSHAHWLGGASTCHRGHHHSGGNRHR